MKTSKIIEQYTYQVEWSEADNTHISRCLEFPSLYAHGNTTESALKEIKIVVEETIKWMQEENENIPEPFSLNKYKENLTLRVPADVHRKSFIKSVKQSVQSR